MKNEICFTIWLLIILAMVGLQSTHAQNLANGSFGVSPTFALANCEGTVVPGFTTFCPVGTGQLYYCLASTTTCATATTGWVQVGGASAAPSLTINNTTKVLPGPFTITAGAAAIGVN